MTLISYYGGKQKIASKVAKQLHGIKHTIYATPFCGGLGVLYAKKQARNSEYREAINDLNEMIVNLYRVARDSPDELRQMIELTPYSLAEYRRANEIYKGGLENASSIDAAWAVYVSAHMSFANKIGAGWGIGRKGPNQAKTWNNKRKCLTETLKRLENIHIDCIDALAFIDRWDSEATLFYCDPPYPGTCQGHYDGYTYDDYQALCDKLDSIKGSYVLSNYPQDIEPQSTQRKMLIKTKNSASGKGKVRTDQGEIEEGRNDRTEVLWICDRNIKQDSAADWLKA